MTRFAKLNEIRTKIWNGDYLGPDGAVALHAYRYRKTPKGRRRNKERVQYAVTLYSARRVMDVIPTYEPLVKHLVAQVPELSREHDANALDVLSTHLLWWSDQEDLVPVMDRVHAQMSAEEVCLLGLEASENEALGGHTRALLLLTYADLCIRVGSEQYAFQYLFEAAQRADSIKDQNQKARVYRKLSYLWGRKLLNLFAAGYYLIRCSSIKAVALDVISKNNPLKANV